jgi:hypothetical protein
MPGEFSSNSKTPKPAKPFTILVCLLINLVVLPGLGSLIAGRRVSGILQAALGLAGTALTTASCAPMLATMIRTGQLPESAGQSMWGGLLGILMFLIAWLWALATGLRLLRNAKRQQNPTGSANGRCN